MFWLLEGPGGFESGVGMVRLCASFAFISCGLFASACSSDGQLKSVSDSLALSGDSIQRGQDGQPGINCWEAHFIDGNGDGIPDPNFDSNDDGFPDADINLDGAFSALDCLGAQGPQGLQGDRGTDGTNGQNGATGANGMNGANGVHCYDGLNPNTDGNRDGVLTVADCQGPAGVNGTNGMPGAPGTNGANCYDGLNLSTDDLNGDGQLTVADCHGRTATPQFDTLEVIKCRAGDAVPGGVDSSGLMNEHFQNSSGQPISETAQCSSGKMLIMSTVTSVKLSENIAAGDTADPKIDYGVASGRAALTDLFPNKIQCFYQNRFPNSPEETTTAGIAVTAMGLCAPIPNLP